MRTFHDHLLTGVSLREDAAVLSVESDHRWSKSEQYEILVHGLIRLRVDGFLQGNIIDSALCHDVTNVEKHGDAIRACIRFALDEQEADPPRWSEGLVARIQAGELMILEIIPSYGAYLVAIGKTITIQQKHSL